MEAGELQRGPQGVLVAGGIEPEAAPPDGLIAVPQFAPVRPVPEVKHIRRAAGGRERGPVEADRPVGDHARGERRLHPGERDRPGRDRRLHRFPGRLARLVKGRGPDGGSVPEPVRQRERELQRRADAVAGAGIEREAEGVECDGRGGWGGQGGSPPRQHGRGPKGPEREAEGGHPADQPESFMKEGRRSTELHERFDLSRVHAVCASRWAKMLRRIGRRNPRGLPNGRSSG